MSPDPQHTGSEAPKGAPRRKHPLWWRLLRATLVGLCVLLIALISMVLVLQTERGAETFRGVLVSQLQVFKDAELQIGSVGGTFLSSLELRDVSLVHTRGDTLVEIDTVRATYRLLPLLQQQIIVDALDITNPRVMTKQEDDGSWDLLNTFPAADEPVDDEPFAYSVRLDDLSLRNGFVSARWFDEEDPLTATLTDIGLTARDFRYSDTDLFGEILQLTMRSVPPGLGDSVTFTARGAFDDRTLTIDTASLLSRRSFAIAEGTVPFGLSNLEATDFTFATSPLAFADIRPFAPGVNPDRMLDLDIQASGRDHRLLADVAGALDDGGTISLAIDASPGLTPIDDEPLRYEIDGQIRDINLSAFWQDMPHEEGVLNADWLADLRGPAVDDLSGSISAEVFDTNIAGFAPERTSFTADFEAGAADIQLTGALRGMELDVAGTTRPFDDVPSYDLVASILNFAPERFLDAEDLTGTLSGSLAVAGSGFDPSTAELTADLQLQPSSVNRITIEQGELGVQLAEGRADFSTAMQFAQGDLSGAGNLTLGDELGYELTQLVFENLNMAAVIGDPSESSFSGTLTLAGRGTVPEELTLEDLQLTLQDSYFGAYTIQELSADAELIAGDLRSTFDALLDGGRIAATVDGTPLADRPQFTLTDGRFLNVDYGILTQQPEQSSDLNGRFELTLDGLDPELMRLRTSVALDSSRVNEQVISEASGTAELLRGQLTSALNVELPEGGFQLEATARPLDEIPSYAVSQGRFERIDVGAFLGLENIVTQLNGQFTLEGLGTDLATMQLESHLNMEPSSLNQATLSSGNIAVSLDEGDAAIQGLLNFLEGNLAVNGRGRLADDIPSYAVSASVDTLDVASLLDLEDLPARLSATLQLEGEGTDLETLTTAGDLSITDGRYGDIELDVLSSQFRMEEGLLTVDELRLTSNIAELEGGGNLAVVDRERRYTSDFELTGQTLDLQPVGNLFDLSILLEEGSIEARATGEPGDVRLTAALDANSLLINNTSITRASLSFESEFEDELASLSGGATLSVGPTSFAALTMDGLDATVGYDGEQFDYVLSVDLDRRRDASMSGIAEFGDEENRVRIDELDLRLDFDRWELLQPSTILIDERYRVRNFLLFSNGQQIALDGVVDFEGNQNVILTLEDVRLAAFADLLGYPGLGGTLNGSIDLTGAAESPQLQGRLRAALESFNEPVGDLTFNMGYDDLALTLDTRLTHEDGSDLTLDGTIPMDLRLKRDEPYDPLEDSLDLALRSDSFSVDWILPFLDPETVDEISGALTARLDIRGTRDDPEMSGRAGVTQGEVRLPALGVTYTGIRGNLTFEGTEATVDELEMRTGRRGRATGSGTIDLSELTLGRFDLELQAREWRAIDTREYRAVTNADIELTGTTREPVIRGSVRVLEADIMADQTAAADLEVVELDERDIQILNQRFGMRVRDRDVDPFDFYDAADIELGVQIDRNVWVRSRRNPEMNIQFTGNIDFEKAPFGEELAFGTIDVVDRRSYIDQFGRRFDIERGTLTFNGPAADPVLDVEAVYRVRSRRSQEPEAIITLRVEGQLERLELTLGSDPQMETTDIISYIVTGRPASESFLLGGRDGVGEDGLVGEGVGFAIGQVANLIENFAGAEFGLDVIEIDQTRGGGTTITAGKFVTRRFFVAVSQPIALGETNTAGTFRAQSYEPTVQLEYSVFDWLLARLAREETGLRINFVWEYAY